MTTTKQKRIKHNYTSELEIKCLLIRAKNKRTNQHHPETMNKKINRLVKIHTKLDNKKYKNKSTHTSRKKLRSVIKNLAIELSTQTNIDANSYERFGEIILLMIKNILKKPNFSGYTYVDDFYSDAVSKIIKYMHNFNYDLISAKTGIQANAFAYISQIIHNSIVYIIIEKKKEQESIKKYIHTQLSDNSLDYKDYETNNHSTTEDHIKVEHNILIKDIDSTLYEELQYVLRDIPKNDIVNVTYPKKYRISFDEYDMIKKITKGNINITRAKKINMEDI